MTPSIPERCQEAGEAPHDALGDGQQDDAREWIETVIESLNERSPDVRQALIKALLDGENTDLNAPHVSGTTSPRPHPVSGTTAFSRQMQRVERKARSADHPPWVLLGTIWAAFLV
jgi:hypothetical protein